MEKRLREPISALTHLFGGVLSIFATFLLINKGYRTNSSRNMLISVIVFGISMILLYFTSGIYHSVMGSQQKIKIYRKLDHSMIYVLIAGTYTPILMRCLSGRVRFIFLLCIWFVVILGVLFRVLYLNAPRILYTLSYVVLGWISVMFLKDIYNTLGSKALLLLVLGGVSYTIGAVIYAIKKPNIFSKLGFHEVFHILIMIGTLFHFLLVYSYVL